MKSRTVTVGSVTYAIKLRKLLLREGIRTRLVKVERSNAESGCTHGLEISEEDFLDAAFVMRENGISYNMYSE